MVLKLYGSNVSFFTQLVAMILIEKEVPFEFHFVDLSKGEHKTREHAEKHPFNYVPYIDDDGYILYESRAIAYYICTKYANQGTRLIPSDIHALGRMHQALSVETAYFNDCGEKLVHEVIIKRIKRLPTRPNVVRDLIDQLSKRLDVYDTILSKQLYMAGDSLTLADLIHVPVGSLLRPAGTDALDTRKNVKRWFNEISSRPSWKQVASGMKPGAIIRPATVEMVTRL